MNNFSNCQTVNDIKTLYRKLCFEHHPDISGYDSTARMQEINAAYLEALKSVDGQTSRGTDGRDHTYRYNHERETAAMDTIRNLITEQLPDGVIVELVGIYVWVSGTERKDKDTQAKLKKHGLKWNGKRKEWFWKPEDYRPGWGKDMSNADLRATYGSRIFEQEEAAKKKRATPAPIAA